MIRSTLALTMLASCSTPAPTQPPPQKCALVLSGNFSGSAETDACASITQSDAGSATLAIAATTPSTGAVLVSINLGSAPAGGTVSSDLGGTWSAAVIDLGDAGCTLQGGSQGVPHGSFTLSGLVLPDAGSIHGVLDAVLFVRAPSETACGPSDIEYLHVAF